MYQTQTSREKFVLFIKIFVPILIYQLANYSASFIDTMMTGQYNTLDLAGVSMATSLWNPFFSLLIGIVSAMVPIIGQYLGRGDQLKIREEFHQFVYLALVLTILLLGVVFFIAIPVLSSFRLELAVFQVGKQYLHYISIGILPLLLFSVCRSFLDALGLTRLSMYFMLLLVPFNTLFNYMLIYGKWGIPALGGAGAGLGTALAYWTVLAIMVLVMSKYEVISTYHIWKWTPFNLSLLKEGLRVGLPIGLQFFSEVSIFSVVGLYMAKFSSQVIASHQAAMNFATLLYAFPSSISSALAIVISYEVGANRRTDVRVYSRLGRLVALGFAGVTFTFLYFFRFQIAALYGHDTTFINLTSHFLGFALLFQLADAFAAPIQGILRGHKDTTIPFILTLLTYWSMTFPVAFLLENYFRIGPEAYWIGMIVGIFVCGIALNSRMKKIVQ